MARKPKATKENLEAWLLKFQSQVKKPIIVSLLIKKSNIEFVSAWVHKKQIEEPEDDIEEQEPTTAIRKARKGIKPIKPLELQSDYIG